MGYHCGFVCEGNTLAEELEWLGNHRLFSWGRNTNKNNP